MSDTGRRPKSPSSRRRSRSGGGAKAEDSGLDSSPSFVEDSGRKMVKNDLDVDEIQSVDSFCIRLRLGDSTESSGSESLSPQRAGRSESFTSGDGTSRSASRSPSSSPSVRFKSSKCVMKSRPPRKCSRSTSSDSDDATRRVSSTSCQRLGERIREKGRSGGGGSRDRKRSLVDPCRKRSLTCWSDDDLCRRESSPSKLEKVKKEREVTPECEPEVKEEKRKEPRRVGERSLGNPCRKRSLTCWSDDDLCRGESSFKLKEVKEEREVAPECEPEVIEEKCQEPRRERTRECCPCGCGRWGTAKKASEPACRPETKVQTRRPTRKYTERRCLYQDHRDRIRAIENYNLRARKRSCGLGSRKAICSPRPTKIKRENRCSMKRNETMKSSTPERSVCTRGRTPECYRSLASLLCDDRKVAKKSACCGGWGFVPKAERERMRAERKACQEAKRKAKAKRISCLSRCLWSPDSLCPQLNIKPRTPSKLKSCTPSAKKEEKPAGDSSDSEYCDDSKRREADDSKKHKHGDSEEYKDGDSRRRKEGGSRKGQRRDLTKREEEPAGDSSDSEYYDDSRRQKADGSKKPKHGDSEEYKDGDSRRRKEGGSRKAKRRASKKRKEDDRKGPKEDDSKYPRKVKREPAGATRTSTPVGKLCKNGDCEYVTEESVRYADARNGKPSTKALKSRSGADLPSRASRSDSTSLSVSSNDEDLDPETNRTGFKDDHDDESIESQTTSDDGFSRSASRTDTSEPDSEDASDGDDSPIPVARAQARRYTTGSAERRKSLDSTARAQTRRHATGSAELHGSLDSAITAQARRYTTSSTELRKSLDSAAEAQTRRYTPGSKELRKSLNSTARAQAEQLTPSLAEVNEYRKSVGEVQARRRAISLAETRESPEPATGVNNMLSTTRFLKPRESPKLAARAGATRQATRLPDLADSLESAARMQLGRHPTDPEEIRKSLGPTARAQATWRSTSLSYLDESPETDAGVQTVRQATGLTPDPEDSLKSAAGMQRRRHATDPEEIRKSLGPTARVQATRRATSLSYLDESPETDAGVQTVRQATGLTPDLEDSVESAARMQRRRHATDPEELREALGPTARAQATRRATSLSYLDASPETDARVQTMRRATGPVEFNESPKLAARAGATRQATRVPDLNVSPEVQGKGWTAGVPDLDESPEPATRVQIARRTTGFTELNESPKPATRAQNTRRATGLAELCELERNVNEIGDLLKACCDTIGRESATASASDVDVECLLRDPVAFREYLQAAASEAPTDVRQRIKAAICRLPNVVDREKVCEVEDLSALRRQRSKSLPRFDGCDPRVSSDCLNQHALKSLTSVKLNKNSRPHLASADEDESLDIKQTSFAKQRSKKTSSAEKILDFGLNGEQFTTPQTTVETTRRRSPQKEFRQTSTTVDPRMKRGSRSVEKPINSMVAPDDASNANVSPTLRFGSVARSENLRTRADSNFIGVIEEYDSDDEGILTDKDEYRNAKNIKRSRNFKGVGGSKRFVSRNLKETEDSKGSRSTRHKRAVKGDDTDDGEDTEVI